MSVMCTVGMTPIALSAGLTVRQQLWPSPVVHHANYVAEGMSGADKTKEDIAYLGGRPVVVLQGGDLFVCAEHEAPIHRDMVQYHNQLGVSTLRHKDVVGIPSRGPLVPICEDTARLADVEPLAVRNMFNGAKIMLPVIVSPGTEEIARRFGLLSETTTRAVDLANNKEFLPLFAELHGFLVPPTRKPKSMSDVENIFREFIDIARSDPERFEEKIWVKLCRSSGGEGVRSFINLQVFMDWLNSEGQGRDFKDAMMSDQPYEGIILQLGVRARENDPVPNINFYVGDSDETDRFIGASAQVIENDSIHVGNDGMLNAADMERISPVTKQVARALRSRGYRGLCGIDVVMGAGGEIWVIDVNARWNASTSTLMLFNDLRSMPGVGAFRYTGKVKVPHRTSVSAYADWLDSQGISFHPDKGGVVPINFMTAHREPGRESYIGASIFATNRATVSEFFELAHMN